MGDLERSLLEPLFGRRYSRHSDLRAPSKLTIPAPVLVTETTLFALLLSIGSKNEILWPAAALNVACEGDRALLNKWHWAAAVFGVAGKGDIAAHCVQREIAAIEIDRAALSARHIAGKADVAAGRVQVEIAGVEIDGPAEPTAELLLIVAGPFAFRVNPLPA